MSTLYLVLIWAGLGLLVGGLTLAARLNPAGWGRYSWLWLLILALGAALAGGLLGFWLFGRLFSTATALWLTVLITCVPGLYAGARKRLASSR